ncbi:MAG: ankyrin repeat domain-containing protein, partial [Endozoicomonadaceae bacterium]|nr:ankyrin repeat domain-containing protein [Endozoicomonadaceae bacterium]
MKLLASSILIINAWRLLHAKKFTTSHIGRPACFSRLCKTIKSLSCCLCLLLLFFCPHSFASNPDTLNTLCELLKKGDAMAAEQLMQAESIDINMKLHVKSGETDDYMTPLMIVVQREYTAFAESLLKRGADINAQNNAGYTALMYAVVQGFTHIVKLLVNHHADLNIKDNNIATALMYAIVGKRVEIAIFLIDNGADLSLQDSSGYTALTYAAAQGQAEIVKHLLKMKAAIDMQEPNGQTPLMIAAERHPD